MPITLLPNPAKATPPPSSIHPHTEPHAESPPVTALLQAWRNGEDEAQQQLMAAVYGELCQLASRYLSSERHGHTLQTGALVHEAYLRLVDAGPLDWQDRSHFFGIAARIMRQILVDHARRHWAAKRGCALQVPLQEDLAGDDGPAWDLLALDNALQLLHEVDPRSSRIVELRFFGGFTILEVANLLSVSPATVKRDWIAAKAWLARELDGGPKPRGNALPESRHAS